MPGLFRKGSVFHFFSRLAFGLTSIALLSASGTLYAQSLPGMVPGDGTPVSDAESGRGDTDQEDSFNRSNTSAWKSTVFLYAGGNFHQVSGELSSDYTGIAGGRLGARFDLTSFWLNSLSSRNKMLPGLAIHSGFSTGNNGSNLMTKIPYMAGPAWGMALSADRRLRLTASVPLGMTSFRLENTRVSFWYHTFSFEGQAGLEFSLTTALFVWLQASFYYAADQESPLMAPGGSAGIGYQF